jgi:hypothetical protein
LAAAILVSESTVILVTLIILAATALVSESAITVGISESAVVLVTLIVLRTAILISEPAIAIGVSIIIESSVIII